ncbi:dynein light chain roadblock-type 2-like [Dermatophagoides pteronyssinus]|uniref:dynein light chain roadblock-type 2-like n=1 Tax=Dermatophagoides pteronyssinus TaxID=6956 RepID=UPI003F678008
MNEIDELLKNIDGQFKDVVGVLIVDRDGIIIKSTINEVVETIQNYGMSIAQIVETSNHSLNENGEIQFLRMKTKRNEFIVVPDKEFMLITILNANNPSLSHGQHAVSSN